MISLKSEQELEAIGRAGAIVGRVHRAVEEHATPGVTTGELDRIAEDLIRQHPGATPAFKGLYGFPATLCVSVNEEVVHGIPSHDRTL
ncbi:MAG: M24 family metallopeptidase, partial [Gemmatimonadota bacterium]